MRQKPHPQVAVLGRRLGPRLGRYPAADKLFEVAVQRDEAGHASGLAIACRLDRSQWVRRAHGAYLLRTNGLEQGPTRLWQWYLQLQQAEAAIRTAKSNLWLRPVFHHKSERVEAQIRVCFLALALWRTLEPWMRSNGLGSCARQRVAAIATIRRMDIVLPLRHGEQSLEIRLRTESKPERLVAGFLHRLDLRLPSRSRVVEKVVAKFKPADAEVLGKTNSVFPKCGRWARRSTHQTARRNSRCRNQHGS